MVPLPVIPRLDSMDKLWIIVILSFLLLVGSLWQVPPNDLWWHARVGSEILDSGRIPRYDAFSLTERGQPFYYQSWLAEVVMAGLLRLGGVRLLIFTRALVMTGLFGTVMLLCWWSSGGDRRAAIPTTLGAILLGLGNQTVRPQLFAYGLFIAIFALLWRYRRGDARRSIWLVPVLVALWVNTHGSFVLGIGLIWLVFLGELLSHALPNLAASPAYASERLRALGLVALLGTGVMLLNPRGVGVVNYVTGLVGSSSVQSLASEWQPPRPTEGLGQSFYVLLLLGAAILALARPPVALIDLVLFLAFGWLGASGLRHIVWFGMVAAPVIAGALPRVSWDDLARWRDRLTRYDWGQRLLYGDGSGYPGFRRLAVVSLTISFLSVALLFLIYPGEDLWLTDQTGIAAVDFMEQQGLQGPLFNELGRGSYLIWRLGPAQPVFIDPRFELYAVEHFEDYLTLSKAECGTETLLTRYDFELLLLDQESQASLVAWVSEQPERWEQVYDDEFTALFQRVGD